MALYDRLQTELVEARRRRDELALNTLSLLKSEVVRATKEADSGGSTDDALVERVARKEVKRRQDAIEAYRKALDVIERLAATDLGNAQWQDELALGYDNVGDTLIAARQTDSALQYFQKAL